MHVHIHVPVCLSSDVHLSHIHVHVQLFASSITVTMCCASILSLQAGVQAQPEKGTCTQHIQDKVNTASKTITVWCQCRSVTLGVPVS